MTVTRLEAGSTAGYDILHKGNQLMCSNYLVPACCSSPGGTIKCKSSNLKLDQDHLFKTLAFLAGLTLEHSHWASFVSLVITVLHFKGFMASALESGRASNKKRQISNLSAQCTYRAGITRLLRIDHSSC